MKIIRKLREIENLSRKTITTHLNISTDALEKYENGKKNPYFPVILKFAKYFDVSVDFLIGGENVQSAKNIKLIKTAKLLDQIEIEINIVTISSVIESLLPEDLINDFKIHLDNFPEKLTDDFHTNLKTIRNLKKLSQEQLGQPINISSKVIFHYENTQYPPAPKLKLLAERLQLSAHCLCTGEKLYWTFNHNNFLDLILKADQLCNLDEHRMLIHIMNKMLSKSANK